MECEDFYIPVVGLTADGQGVFLTDQGRVALTAGTIEVGCDNCLAVIDERTMSIRYQLRPHWDTGAYREKPVFREDGSINWKTKFACLSLEPANPFQELDEESCVAPSLVPATPEDVNRVRDARIFPRTGLPNKRLHIDLYRIPGSPYLVYSHGISCT
jgi:hypothetical protein